ncbi:MAG: hypothetical protein JXN64_06415 [Spirochaetes bacterium]|nr:hypothetical protein [Spirochaetota bacterium]
MSKPTERIPNYILKDIRKNVPVDRNEFTDEEINRKTNYQLLNHYLNWNGIIGYTDSIIDVVESIFNVDLSQKE